MTYPRYHLKALVLPALKNNPMTIRGLFDYVGHGSYDSFRSYMSKLKERRYVTLNDGYWTLTAKGVLHCDPYYAVHRRQERIQSAVDAILQDNTMFVQAVETEVSNRIGNGGHVSGGSGGQAPASASINDSKVIEALKAKDDEIARLQMQLLHLKRSQAPTGPMHTGPGQPAKTPEQVREEKLRIKKRRKLAEAYASRNMLLDAAFFAKYGDLRPYKLKFKQWLSDNSIEIMSKNNPEIRRGHAHKQPIPPHAVAQCQFRIVKMDSKGITVAGRGLPDGKARMTF